ISLMTSRTFMPQATVWPLTGYERDTRTRHGGADPRPPRTRSLPRRRRRRRPRLRRRSGAGGRVRSGLRRDGGRGDAARGGRPAAGAGGDPPRARARRVTRRYGTTFGMKPFLTLCLIALHGCAQAAAQPLRTWERLDLPIEEGLRLALDQQLPHRDALDYILWAGYRGSPSDRTLLRQIVEGYEEERLPQSYARVALSSLEFLGEDEDYFVSLARHWDEAEDAEARERRKWVAYYAGMSIARRPTPEVLAAFEEINARTSDGYLNGAFGMPRFIAHYMKQYRSLPSVGEKVERTAAWTWPDKVQMAVDWTRFGWVRGGLHGFRENLN